jgi:hypothetical protein
MLSGVPRAGAARDREPPQRQCWHGGQERLRAALRAVSLVASGSGVGL